MSPRTQTRPLDDPRMWRRLVARTHPDVEGGDHELFIWTGTVKDAVCGGDLRVGPKPPPRAPEPQPEPRSSKPPAADDKPRVPYDATGADFEEVTRQALLVEGPYADVLSLLVDCYPLEHHAYEQERGASYKRLAAIAHSWGMSKRERTGWYRCAESIPLSDRHAGHILSKLKRRRAA